MISGERHRLQTVRLSSILILQWTCFVNLINLLNSFMPQILYVLLLFVQS